MAANPTPQKGNRYPGVQPFRTSDSHRFFGRDEDIENLHDFILLEKLVVLFGKSGYGKSSLLSAGVLPRLMDEKQPAAHRFRPVEVRFGNYVAGSSFAPLETVRRIVEKEMPAAAPDLLALQVLTGLPPTPTLWQLFKQRQFPAESPLSPADCQQPPATQFILLFDQFEELFSYPPQQQEAFRRQLAELLFSDLPQQERSGMDALDESARRRLAQPMSVKAVFAIRSDRMSLLDSMKDALPTILHKRYELRPLTRAQAADAIVKPALLGHDAQESWRSHYDSPPFEYRQDAIDAMLAPLMTTEGQEAGKPGVEAFLLQILCEYVEDLVKKGKAPDLDGNGLPDITPVQLPDMNNLLEDYVHRKLDELDPALRTVACRLLEEGLLEEDAGEGRRTSVDGKSLLGRFRREGLTQAVLDDLEKTYLVRREPNTVGGFSYEISHDRLVGPVMKMKEERKAEEEKTAAAKRMRRLIGFSAAAAAAASAAIGFGVWAFNQKAEAEKAKQAAQQALINSYNSDIDRFRQEIGMAERNLTSYKLYGADPDVILLDSNRIDSLTQLIDTLQSEIKSLEK